MNHWKCMCALKTVSASLCTDWVWIIQLTGEISGTACVLTADFFFFAVVGKNKRSFQSLDQTHQSKRGGIRLKVDTLKQKGVRTQLSTESDTVASIKKDIQPNIPRCLFANDQCRLWPQDIMWISCWQTRQKQTNKGDLYQVAQGAYAHCWCRAL